MNRRDLLKGSGALIVGFVASRGAATLSIGSSDVALAQSARTAADVDSWLVVGADGIVTAYTGKCELGQGLHTAQVQLVAEELDVPVARVRLVMCDTSRTPDQGTTSGSQSHPTNFNHANLALAAASAREALIALGATRLGVSRNALRADAGFVVVRSDPAQRVAYADLVGGKSFDVPLDPNVKRKAHADWKVLGTSVPRVDLSALVTGRTEFVHNVRLDGMLHGRVVRPPGPGATLVSVNEQSVAGMPGVVRVVVKGNFVGDRRGTAVSGRTGSGNTAGHVEGRTRTSRAGIFYDYLRRQPSRDALVVDSGDVDAALARATTVIKATYLHPYQMHGSVGVVLRGRRCSARARNRVVLDAVGVSAAQHRRDASRAADRAGRVVFTVGSGCYGINGADTVAYDAALMSQAVGRPVRVQLSRQDEMAWENYGFAYVIDQRAGVDASGTIVGWDYEAWYPSLGGRPGYETPGNVVTGRLAGFQPASVTPRAAARPTRFANGSNAAPSYVTGCAGATCGGTGTISAERVLTHTSASPFFTGPLRSPSRLQNTFAHECFLDEIAARVKADPVAYRLRHLRDPRLIEVVKAAAKAANWDTRPSPRSSRARSGTLSGRGFACVLYEGDNGYCAMVAEVDVEQESGRITAKRFVVAQDCGPISNPDGMKNQIEGGALQGLSRALGEEVTWDAAKVTSIDWRTYRSLSLGFDVPSIESVLIDRADGEAMGAGETTITIVAAAVANAVFDATGARIREVPFTPERVKAALL